MVTWADIFDDGFDAALASAADALETAADGFGGIAEDYDREVAHLTRDGRLWTGMSADVATLRFSDTAGELAAAEAEARALAGLVRDGRNELVRLRSALTSLAADAAEAGFTVDSHGRVHDTLDRPGNPDVEDARVEWQRSVDQAVAAVSEADTNLRLALDQVAEGRDGRHAGIFNGSAADDVDDVLGDRAEELARRVTEGGDLTDAEWAELDRLLELNADDPEFSRTLLAGLGPDGLAELSARVLADPSEHHTRLRDGIAAALATAMRPPPVAPGSAEFGQWSRSEAGRFYTGFLADLREAGVAAYAAPGLTDHEVRGYQLFVSLLDTEPPQEFDARFLHDLADDVRAAEDPSQGGDPDLWRLRGDDLGVDGVDAGELDRFTADPLDGLLGIMSRDPAVAAGYLDPATGGDRLEYLLNERSWSSRSLSLPGGPVTMPDAVGPGFAAALESATTGIPYESSPGTAALNRTEEGARVMEKVVEEFSENPSRIAPGGDFSPMREELSHMTAAYMAEVQQAVSRMEVFPNEFLAADFMGMDLAPLLSTLAADPEAYEVLSAAQQAHTALALDHAMNGPETEGVGSDAKVGPAVAPGSMVAWILNDARADAVYSGAVASDAEFNGRLETVEEWTGMVLDEVVGRLGERYPVAGPILEWGVSELSTAFFESMQRDTASEAAQDAAEGFREGLDATQESAREAMVVAGRAAGLPDNSIQALTNIAIAEVTKFYVAPENWEGQNDAQ